MTDKELFDLLINNAKRYRGHAIESLERNSHLHYFMPAFDVDPEQTEPLIDAVLVDFINYIAYRQCVDLGLHASDLQKEDDK